MMINTETKYEIKITKKFKANYKKIKKQNKDTNKLIYIITKLANKEQLEIKYQDHALNNSKKYKDCHDCHIEPDWILIYKYLDNELILLLVATGSHNEIL